MKLYLQKIWCNEYNVKLYLQNSTFIWPRVPACGKALFETRKFFNKCCLRMFLWRPSCSAFECSICNDWKMQKQHGRKNLKRYSQGKRAIKGKQCNKGETKGKRCNEKGKRRTKGGSYNEENRCSRKSKRSDWFRIMSRSSTFHPLQVSFYAQFLKWQLSEIAIANKTCLPSHFETLSPRQKTFFDSTFWKKCNRRRKYLKR